MNDQEILQKSKKNKKRMRERTKKHGPKRKLAELEKENEKKIC